MEHKVLQYRDGRYFVDIDISVDEWKDMLSNANIFFPKDRKMVLYWYHMPDHQASAKTIINQYSLRLNKSPFNSNIQSLSPRILKHLNRFWVEQATKPGRPSYWCILFEGWHEAKSFVWKLRDELVQAIDESEEQWKDEWADICSRLNIQAGNESGDMESIVEISDKEGKKTAYYTTKYERSNKNRDIAIRYAVRKNGRLICESCGFDFEAVYGNRGIGFIEVHHNKPLFSLQEEREIDPKIELNCLCSNCHRMIHRYKNDILSVAALKKMIQRQKASNEAPYETDP